MHMAEDFTVLIMQPLPESALEYLRGQAVRVLLGYEGDDWRARAGDVDALIYYSVPVDRRLLDQLPRLTVIGKRGVGIDTVDLPAARARGIRITNIQGEDGNAVSVSEHAVALLFAVRRRLVARDPLTRRGQFEDRLELPLGDEVTGSRIGLIGAGNIGRRIGNTFRAGFGCQIGYYDPYLDAGTAGAFGGTRFTAVAPLFEWSDSVLVAAPLTAETRGLIGERELRLLGPRGVIVVSSRGGIVDETDLAAALRSGAIWGAGVDVYDGEPPAPDNPLFTCENAVLTPHVGGATVQSRERTSLSVCQQVLALLRGGQAPLADQSWLAGADR